MFPTNKNDALKRNYKFWNTQPVPKLNESIEKNEIIEPNLVIDQLALPTDYLYFVEYDYNSDHDLLKISNFLDKYYVEDDDGDFRLHYSTNFLKWALQKEGTILLAIEMKETELLVGFISAILSKNKIYITELEMAEIDFLCIHPKLRDKRLAPIMIKELSRRVMSKHNINVAIYTAWKYLPTPFTTAQYYHRAINTDILVKTGFMSNNIYSNIISNMPSNIIKMKKEHTIDALKCLNKYFDNYMCHPIFSEEEFVHTFLDSDIVCSYVLLDSNYQVVDFASFYKLPYKIIKSNKFVHAAYLYYYSNNSDRLLFIINSMLIAAKNEGMDVLNALDIMENKKVFNSLEFFLGTGKLNYYLYNYRCVEMLPFQVAKLLL